MTADPDTAPRRILALLRACHPIPTVGVTAYSTALGVIAGLSAGRCVLLATAVLAGQVGIGWSNDRLDVSADRAVDRRDKPLATGVLSLRAVEVGIAVSLPVTAGLSLALGWRAGLLHLAAVGCGWIYNRWLKGTWFSAVPYAFAFAALPAVATLALRPPTLPAWWAMAAGALLGIAANLTNALPDLERDRRTGFHGLPSRIGARPAIALAAALLLAAAAVAGFAPPGRPGPWSWGGMAVSVVAMAALAPFAWRRARSRMPFYALMLVVPVLLAMLATNGDRLR